MHAIEKTFSAQMREGRGTKEKGHETGSKEDWMGRSVVKAFSLTTSYIVIWLDFLL